LRAADLLFRLGPNELGVLLLTTPTETCAAIADRISRGASELAGTDTVGRITVTSATTPGEGASLASLIAAARSRRGRDPHVDPLHQDSSGDSIH
jgi:GGDEF domain-containing protein